MPVFRAVIAVGSLLTALLAVPLLGAPPAAADIYTYQPGALAAVEPTRVLDTRSGIGAPRATVPVGAIVTFPVAAGPTEPGGSNQGSVVLNVAVPTPVGAGSLSVFTGGTTWNGHVSMSLTGGNIEQVLTVPLGLSHTVSIRNNAATPIDLVANVVGSYVGGTVTLPGMFVPLNVRLADSRGGIGLVRQQIPARGRASVAFAGHGGIAAGASAATADLAVLNSAAAGTLSITASDQLPSTRPIRFGARIGVQTQRNLRLGATGVLVFTNNSAAPIDLVIDVAGYNRGGSTYEIGSYTPVVPRALSSTPQGFAPGAATIPVFTGTDETTDAANVLIEPSNPATGAAIAVHDLYGHWDGSPAVQSTANRLPGEYPVQTQLLSEFEVRLLAGNQHAFTAYLTGYYCYPKSV